MEIRRSDARISDGKQRAKLGALIGFEVFRAAAKGEVLCSLKTPSRDKSASTWLQSVFNLVGKYPLSKFSSVDNISPIHRKVAQV